MKLIKEIFNKHAWKLFWPFYLGNFLVGSLLIFAPFFIVFFRDIGLSFFQIGILIAVQKAAQILFEVPSGAFADTFGRKASAILGVVFWMLPALSLFFFQNYYVILLAFFVMGIADSFQSGTYEAWITDMLEKDKKRHFYLFL